MKNILKLGMAAIVALLLVTTTTAVECPDGEVPICHLPDGVFFPHPNDCEWFFHCSNNVAYCMKCPADLHWNVELETCDYPYRAGCSEAIIPGTPYIVGALYDDVYAWSNPNSHTSTLNMFAPLSLPDGVYGEPDLSKIGVCRFDNKMPGNPLKHKCYVGQVPGT